MSIAPKTGERILLCYFPKHYSTRSYRYEQTTETKWEECRWFPDENGSKAHFEPWCGEEKTRTTLHIDLKDCYAWLPLPTP